MTQDWKDMLASLKGDSNDNTENSEARGEGNIGDTPQKAPKQNLRVVIDKKGRKGKTATIIEGFTLDDDEVEELASELKRKIGTGGSARGGEILLQGDWKEKVLNLLKEKGYNVKA